MKDKGDGVERRGSGVEGRGSGVGGWGLGIGVGCGSSELYRSSHSAARARKKGTFSQLQNDETRNLQNKDLPLQPKLCYKFIGFPPNYHTSQYFKLVDLISSQTDPVVDPSKQCAIRLSPSEFKGAG